MRSKTDFFKGAPNDFNYPESFANFNYSPRARVRQQRVRSSINPGKIFTTSASQTPSGQKIAGFKWSKLAQVGGAVGLVGGLATPVGATVWKLSGQLSSLASQVKSTQRSIDEVKSDIKEVKNDIKSLEKAIRQDIKSLDERITNLALTVAQIQGAKDRGKAIIDAPSKPNDTR